MSAIRKEALPFIPVPIKLPDFGCSAFHITSEDGDELMGRNYDFKNNTSAMLVRTHPKNGYRSIAFAALDNLSANMADKSISSKMACLMAPFLCLDGMNEKGVSIAVLTLDSEPTHQYTKKKTIATTLAIRLILDQASSTEEAVELLSNYDMFATNGRDYHFFLSDAVGDSRIVEYDLTDGNMVVTPVRSATNFFEIRKEQVLPNQYNAMYGHGKERYDMMESIFTETDGHHSKEVAWRALKAAAQKPKEGDVTSNTQWSAVYNNTKCEVEISIRRDWDTMFTFSVDEQN